MWHPQWVASVTSAAHSPLRPQTIKKTRFPHWDEVLELRETRGTASPLRVELWDWDMVGKNDFLGMVSVPRLINALCGSPLPPVSRQVRLGPEGGRSSHREDHWPACVVESLSS